jgi:hypothetical protein
MGSELKARLQYAMAKVKNGWESLPINEVETIASQSASPSSTTSTINGRLRPNLSPPTRLESAQLLSSLSQSTVPPPTSQGSQLSGSQQPRTYDSFWREQSLRQTQLSASMSPQSTQQQAALGPPVDLYARPSHLRRSPSKTSQQRGLQPNSSDLSVTSTTSGPNGLTSPPTLAPQQYQAQKSAQEQNAIETLLFMSSPGNPPLPYFGAAGAAAGSQTQTSRVASPLKTSFPAQASASLPNKASIPTTGPNAGHHGSASTSSSSTTPKPILYERQKFGFRGPRRSLISDEKLDRWRRGGMGEESSDEDEIEIPLPSSIVSRRGEAQRADVPGTAGAQAQA